MSRASEAATSIHNQFTRVRNELGLWQEKATTISSGLAKTTGFKTDDVESAEAWAFIDSLDSVAVNDPVALVNLGGKPVLLGKIVRTALGTARIRRQIALTGAQATFSLPAGHTAGTGASVTGSDGNDNAGLITLVAGTGPAIGTILRIAFAQTRDSVKYNVFLTPRNANARTLGGVVGQVTTSSSLTELETRTALTASVTYIWGYQIVGFE